MRRGAIILCGGQSARMQKDKAWLDFGGETMLQRVVRITCDSMPAANVVVVSGARQGLPSLPEEVAIVRDQGEHQGPLPALARGLRALADRTDAVWATGCDTPFIAPTLINFLSDALESYQVVLPDDSQRCYPLTAVYRTDIVATVEEQLDAGQRSLHRLVDVLHAHRVPTAMIRQFDPELLSLLNVNTSADYAAALAHLGTGQK